MGSAPDSVAKLVETFTRHVDAYRSGNLNETEVRVQFIDPLFIALGWDVRNESGYAAAYKDVIHEDAIKAGAPDYCFTIGGARKFFLEAKRPSVDIGAQVAPAYQLRRYAWSAKLPLSILTDFEELAVYDCRVRPNPSDKPAVARTMYLKHTDYLDRWDEIAAIFSKQAVMQGSFDKYVAGKKKAGTAEVDAEFLREIEKWREGLARNIAIRNPRLTVRELNSAVQLTIDRIIFLRICEDRGAEPTGQLQALIGGDAVYKRLMQLFHAADDRYNSGLFHFQKERDRPTEVDELTPRLRIDDKVLKDIFKSLYYPLSPYEFSVVPADILGNVYEQFLGKVISLTAGHRARVEEKPEVKKAGGVYYTPKYIVDYIVEHTVGRVLTGGTDFQSVQKGGTGCLQPVSSGKGKSTACKQAVAPKELTPKQISKLRILDPACGSGSFLIGAYRRLIAACRDWYVADGPEKHTKEIHQGAGARLPTGGGQGQWYLTNDEKKRILLANIYGVDIDPQAVEVTKLNLLLCALENESHGTMRQLALIHKRALPDLGSNIKCGNSLIGTDFYQNKQLAFFDEETRYKINAFDWEDEFPEIFSGKNPGFDAVIGNPPYIRVRFFKEFHPEEVAYLEQRYACATHVWDIYLLFFERAVGLLRREGRCGLIVPIQTLHQPNCQSLRRLLFERTNICLIADLSKFRVFLGPTVKNCVIVVAKGRAPESKIVVTRPDSPESLLSASHRHWPQKVAASNPGLSLKTELLSPRKHLCNKLRAHSLQLSELFYVTFGLRSCAKGKGEGGKDRLVVADPRAPHAKPYLEGRDMERYGIRWPRRYIQYIPEEMYSPRCKELFESPKIVSQTMLSRMRLVATLDKDGYYVEQSLLCIIPHGILTERRLGLPEYPLEFVLGVLNSSLASFYFRTFIIDYSLGGGLVHATPGSQGKLLIPRVALEQTHSVARSVREMLTLHKQLSGAKTGHEKELLQRQIAGTDREIDWLIYELYGLTEEEIKIVEGNV